MHRQLRKRNRKLKKEIKEYKILNPVIKQENEKFRAQSINLQKEIKSIKMKNKKISDINLKWTQKFKFQVAKTNVLKNKIKVLRTEVGTSSNNLNILATAVSLHQV